MWLSVKIRLGINFVRVSVLSESYSGLLLQGMEEAARYLARSFSFVDNDGEVLSAGHAKRRKSRSVPELRPKHMTKGADQEYYRQVKS